ncbi:MAG: anti-sigma factor [Sneathiellales bacterium]|nr:anti-sigma factor [Sneathiellales bacterium]
MTEQDFMSEEKLHAYVDGQLSAVETLKMEQWLSKNPDDAATVHAYILQNAQMRQAFSSIAEEDVPDTMREQLSASKPTISSFFPGWRQMAASLLLIGVGVLAGLGSQFLGTQDQQGERQVFASSAIGAHKVFVSEIRHPVEVTAKEEQHLVKWLSKRLGTSIKAPDLAAQGYQLMGGRLLSEGEKPAAQFMYEKKDGRRLTLYVRSSDTAEDTAFQFAANKGVSAFYWVDQNYAYAMVAPVEKQDLMSLATAVYEELENN